jgi:putative ABC transport system permease protein
MLNQRLTQQGFHPDALYPQIRARLTLKNNKPFSSTQLQDDALKRDLNLSWVQSLPPGNTLVNGTWWNATQTTQAQVSAEQKLAERLHLKLGDKLTFQTNTQTFTATLTSIRTLRWDSFRPNFYFLFPPGFIQHEPITYMTSLRINPQQKPAFMNILQTFPNLTVIDVAAILSQIQTFLGQASQSLSFVLIWALLFILLLLYELKQLYQSWRQSWSFLLKVLGCTQDKRRTFILIELSLILAFSMLISGMIIGLLQLWIKHSLL